MKLTIGPAGVGSPGRLGLFAVVLLVCGACGTKETHVPAMAAQPGPHATAKPPFVMSEATIRGHKAEVMTHLQTQLTFDTGPAADHRPLLNQDRGHLIVGPDAILAPEVGAGLLDSSWAWADTGRVLARITLSADYPLLHLKQGVTYVCVRSTDQQNPWGSAKAFLIHVANNTIWDSIFSLPLKVKKTTGPARWVVGSTDDNFCVPCNTRYCCTTQ